MTAAISGEQIEELTDRLHGHGMTALRPDDWPILVTAMERLSATASFGGAMEVVEQGWNTWAGKEHNKRWVNRIDGTPIPNDLKVNIAMAITEVAMPQS